MNPYFDRSKPHHTPEGFKNNDPAAQEKGFGAFARWQWERLRNGMPPAKPQTATPVTAPDLAFVSANAKAGAAMQPAITWVGHSTMLVQANGLNVLTDPVFSERASPVQFAGPKRAQPPGLRIDQLPAIDVVLISHNHFDHLDLPTLRMLDARDQPRVIVPLGNRPLVARAMPASTVTEHDWGAAVPLRGDAVLHLEPMLHGSGRSPLDQQRTLWAAFVLKAAGLKLYHVGDSGYGDGRHFRDAAAKHGGFDLVMLPIGAYEPASFMADAHMSPAQAVKAAGDARAARAMAHHFGAFQLGFESFEAPVEDLLVALKAASLPAEAFPALQPGQSITVRPSKP